MLAFFRQLDYTMQVLFLWLIGQAVKTSPSHGENRGSIPLSTAEKLLVIQELFCSIGSTVLHESAKAMIPIEQKAPPGDRTAAEWNHVAYATRRRRRILPCRILSYFMKVKQIMK